MSDRTATIYERGNGFPAVGAFVKCDDGELYRLVERGPRIITGARLGDDSHIPFCRVELVDWTDTQSDDEVFPCRCAL